MKTGFEAAEVLLKTDDDRPWLDTQRQPPRVRAMLIYRRHRRQANLLPLVFVAPPRIYIYIYIYISADESSLLKLTAGQAHTSALLKAINSGEKALLHDGGRLVGGVCGVRVGFSSQNIVERGTLYASGWRHA